MSVKNSARCHHPVHSGTKPVHSCKPVHCAKCTVHQCRLVGVLYEVLYSKCVILAGERKIKRWRGLQDVKV